MFHFFNIYKAVSSPSSLDFFFASKPTFIQNVPQAWYQKGSQQRYWLCGIRYTISGYATRLHTLHLSQHANIGSGTTSTPILESHSISNNGHIFDAPNQSPLDLGPVELLSKWTCCGIHLLSQNTSLPFLIFRPPCLTVRSLIKERKISTHFWSTTKF